MNNAHETKEINIENKSVKKTVKTILTKISDKVNQVKKGMYEQCKGFPNGIPTYIGYFD